jgi:hypothetical protein
MMASLDALRHMEVDKEKLVTNLRVRGGYSLPNRIYWVYGVVV